MCTNNEDNGSTHLSPNKQNQAIESHSNISENDTNHNSMESKSQSSGDENDAMQDEIDDEIDNDDELPYEIDDTEPHKNLLHYPIDNKIFEVDERDVKWKREDRDGESSCGPFLSNSSTIIDLTDPTPELFFNQLFDNRMWTIITDYYYYSKI